MYNNTSIRRGGEGNEEDGAHQANKHAMRNIAVTKNINLFHLN